MPAEGVESFPPELHLEHEANIARYGKLMRNRPLLSCDECSRDPALETVSFCCTCTGFLCELCHQAHLLSRRATVNHKVLLLKDFADFDAPLRENLTISTDHNTCSLHDKEEIRLYCSQCQALLCIQCALIEHSGHSMEDLSIFIKQEKVSIAGKLAQHGGMAEKLDEVISNGKALCEGIKARKKIIDDDITKTFAELRRNLDEKEASLLQQCSEMATSKVTSQTLQIDELDSLKNTIGSSMQFFDRSKDDYSNSEFLPVLGTLHACVDRVKEKVEGKSLQLVENDVINFNTDTSAAVSAIYGFQVTLYSPRDYTTVFNPVMSVKTSNPYHVAVHENGDIVVANHTQHTVEVYNKTGANKTSFKSGGTHPLGVSIVGDILYVVEFSSKRCHKMTVNGESLCVIGEGQLNLPWGCAISDNGTLYIADEGSNRVQAFNPDGTLQKTLCANPQVTEPRDVAIDQHQNIHVTTKSPGCIKVFDADNNFIRDYGKEVLSWPSGVAVDSFGFCLVGDWEGKCLHIFDPTGKHIHKIGHNGYVCGVAVDGENSVYVVNYTSKYVYKY